MRLLRRRASNWSPWTEDEVVDGTVAARLARTYIEHCDVRQYLEKISPGRTIAVSCDIGAGYGRMLPILEEFSERVVAVEREKDLADLARRFYPRCEVHRIATLECLPFPSSTFDFVLSFTVMQHLSNAAVGRAASEVVRVLKPAGSLLLCEETDAKHAWGDVEDPLGKFTLGRTPSEYARLFAPLKLIETSPRRVEPGYPRADVGSYMLFSAA